MIKLMQGMVNEQVVREHLKQICETGLRAFCRKNDLDAGNVSNIINGNKPMMDSVAEALGYEPIKSYFYKG